MLHQLSRALAVQLSVLFLAWVFPHHLTDQMLRPSCTRHFTGISEGRKPHVRTEFLKTKKRKEGEQVGAVARSGVTAGMWRFFHGHTLGFYTRRRSMPVCHDSLLATLFGVRACACVCKSEREL